MAKQEKAKSTKRFGARYGRTVKERFGAIESEQRKLHKCPYCEKEKVKRLSPGIWQCKKCNAKFTGRAYTITSKKKVKEEIEEPIEETTEEAEMPDEENLEDFGEDLEEVEEKNE